MENPLSIKQRKRKYINLGISLDPTYCDFDKNQPKPSCSNRDYIEKIMSDRVSEYRTKVLELTAENKEFTANSLADAKNTRKRNTTVATLFKEHIESLKEQKRYGYAESIQQVYNSLLKFNKHLEILFSEIDI